MEIGRGAEAVITLEEGVVKKHRNAKSYRQPTLDERIRQERTLREARIMSDARRHGVLTPIICDVSRFELKMERIVGEKLKDVINEELSEIVGETVGRLHRGGIVHGDLTTSNMILTRGKICLIDFGLSFYERACGSAGSGCACILSDPGEHARPAAGADGGLCGRIHPHLFPGR